MATMGPREYAKRYWEMEVPIINDNNEIVSYEKVDFNKYRLWQGWVQKPPSPPPGLMDFLSAVDRYANGFFKQGKRLDLQVTNVWGAKVFLGFVTEKDFRPLRVRAAQAFSGKGSPEDVQLTLQLAARCGVATNGLQQYCDEIIDRPYPRLGLDCNGFVGNYLRYKNSATTWNYYDVDSADIINGESGIQHLITKNGTPLVKNVDDMVTPRMHILGMVDSKGAVINGGAGGVGHIMITDSVTFGNYEARPPIPKEYLKGRYLVYLGVEATPGLGLSIGYYMILKIANNGVATVWRDRVGKTLNVKIYPVK